MRVFSKAVLAILFTVPLAAQRPQPSVSGQPAILLHFGERSGQLYDELRALPEAEELLDIGLGFDSMPTTTGFYTDLAKGLGLSPASAWVLIDASPRLLLQGSGPPTVVELRKALNEVGIISPIGVLRDFLKQRPDHLEARMQLLAHLRRIAESRTRKVLGLNVEGVLDMGRLQDQDADGTFNFLSRMFGNVDASRFEGLELDTEQDIQIWGAYAQEMQTLFANGDWRLLDIHTRAKQDPIESCSPLMVQFYGRHLTEIEDALVEYPTSKHLWGTYLWTKAVARRGSIRELIDRVVPSSEMGRRGWLDVPATALVIAEDRANGNWASVAETVLEIWPALRFAARSASKDAETGKWLEGPTKGYFEFLAQNTIDPLIESLIRLDRIGEAETIISDMAHIPFFGDFRRRAADMARVCGREDLRDKWLTLQIPPNVLEADMEHLHRTLSYHLYGTSSPFVLLIGHGRIGTMRMDAMLGFGRLFEWRIRSADLDDELSALIRQREGWPATGMHWALIGDDCKILAHGSDIPMEEEIHLALIQAGVRPHAESLRRFHAENPEHLVGRLELLTELKRLAEHRTMERLFHMPNGIKDIENIAHMPPQLSQEDDLDIWVEYATLYRRVLPQLLEKGHIGIEEQNNPFISEMFILSQTMKEMANPLLHQVEAAMARRPTNEFLWGVWLSLSAFGENGNIKDLVTSLHPSPLDDPLDLPPGKMRKGLMNQLRYRSKWQTIMDIQEWRWEALKNNTSELRPRFWEEEVKPLLEAYVRLGKDNEADALLMHWSQAPDWGDILEDAIYTAKDCERNDLAERWGKR